MSDPTPSEAKPNPFYQASRVVPAFVRRKFVGLMALTFGWVVVRGAEGDKKGKGGGGKELKFFIEQAQEIGVRFLVCQPSLDLHGYTMDDMIEGVEMIGGAAFNDMACDADAVIGF